MTCVLLRYDDEHEINSVVGPFETADEAEKYAIAQWGDLNSEEYDIFPLTPTTPTDWPTENAGRAFAALWNK